MARGEGGADEKHENVDPLMEPGASLGQGALHIRPPKRV